MLLVARVEPTPECQTDAINSTRRGFFDFGFFAIAKCSPRRSVVPGGRCYSQSKDCSRMFFPGGDPFGGGGFPGGGRRGPAADVDTTKLYEILGVSLSCLLFFFDCRRCTSNAEHLQIIIVPVLLSKRWRKQPMQKRLKRHTGNFVSSITLIKVEMSALSRKSMLHTRC